MVTIRRDALKSRRRCGVGRWQAPRVRTALAQNGAVADGVRPLEDYYEQDDDCRGADYYWEQHEDCDY